MIDPSPLRRIQRDAGDPKSWHRRIDAFDMSFLDRDPDQCRDDALGRRVQNMEFVIREIRIGIVLGHDAAIADDRDRVDEKRAIARGLGLVEGDHLEQRLRVHPL